MLLDYDDESGDGLRGLLLRRVGFSSELSCLTRPAGRPFRATKALVHYPLFVKAHMPKPVKLQVGCTHSRAVDSLTGWGQPGLP